MMRLKSQTLQFKTYHKQIAYVGTTDINKKSECILNLTLKVIKMRLFATAKVRRMIPITPKSTSYYFKTNDWKS